MLPFWSDLGQRMLFDRLKRRQFITLLGGAAAWPLVARAQRRERVRRIGVLMSFAASDPDAQLRIGAFDRGMRDLGWLEGRNLHTEYRWAADEGDALRNHARELVRMAPDVILVNSTPATLALHEQGGSVPAVFVQVTDPVGAGLVTNLGLPGGNLTGFTTFEFSVGSKWLEMLRWWRRTSRGWRWCSAQRRLLSPTCSGDRSKR